MTMSRSENMSRIRSSDTEPEWILRRGLWQAGLRYRVGFKTPGGKADVAVPSLRFAVFIDGCFWHGCPEHYVRPRSRNSFWDDKLIENVERDVRQTTRLLDAGWIVVRLWEHEVREAPSAATRIVLNAMQERRHRLTSWRVYRVEFLDKTGARELRSLRQLRGTRRRQESGERSTLKTGRVRRAVIR